MVTVLFVAVLAAGSTVLAALALHRGERRLTERTADQQATAVAQAVDDRMDRYSDYLTGLAAAVGAQQSLESAEFDAITAPVRRTILPGLSGVAYVVPVKTGDIGKVQTYWRARGATGLVLRPAPGTGRHLFVIYARSAGRTPARPGGDLSTVAPTATAMTAANTTGDVILSAAHVLRRDAELPPARQQQGFVLAAPVHGTRPAADAGRLRGWLLLGLRSGDFLSDVIGPVAGRSVSVDLSDISAGIVTPVTRWQPDARPAPDLAARVRIVEAPGRTWELTVRPTAELIDRPAGPLSRVALGIGAVITGLLLALTVTMATSRDRARRLVRVATDALREDIRRREQVEQQLRHREAELVGFAGVIAHDLRNPLARMRGYTDFLRDEIGAVLDREHRDFLDRLSVCEHQMTELIDDLLGYATADNRTLNVGRVDLHALVQQIVRDRADSFGAREAAITVGALPVVDGDPTLLRQAFDNLISNAVKYTAPDRLPRVRIDGEPAGPGRWLIEVRDNGIGIPEHQREAVFTAFTRADGSDGFPGTGLGLAIVRRIVERHGGTVTVEPGPHEGSRFRLLLPIDARRPAGVAAAAPGPAVMRPARSG